jgi:hypothetical protein
LCILHELLGDRRCAIIDRYHLDDEVQHEARHHAEQRLDLVSWSRPLGDGRQKISPSAKDSWHTARL